MYPFNPQSIFAVNEGMDAKVLDLPNGKGKYLVADNFYADPHAVRELIRSTPYPLWQWNEESRNGLDYYDCRHHIHLPCVEPQQAIAQLAQRGLGVECGRGTAYFNTNFFRLLAEQPEHSQPFPHDDGDALAALIMLNTEEECSGGTAFYRSIEPPLDCMPLDPAENQRVRKAFYAGELGHKGKHYFLSNWDSHFERLALVEMKFNRLLLYPGILFHGHWQEQGAFQDIWRMNQLFFFDDSKWHDYFWEISGGKPKGRSKKAARKRARYG